ncbi:apolipoprotein L6-like [Menidia menidia]
MICEKLPRRLIGDFDREISPDTAVNLSPLLSEEDVLRMNEHINQLDQIRMDPDFRMVFLFQRVTPSHFLDLLSTHEPEMLRFLSDLEEVAVNLDKMNKGAKISSVANSSARTIGGILSIVGLALIPVTAGASVALSASGLVLEGGIGATNAITNLTGIWVNYQNLDKAQKAFKSFVTCMQEIQSCLKEASSQTGTEVQTSTNDVLMELDGADLSMGGVRKNVESLSDNVKEVEAGLSLASDLPDVSQAVVEGTLTLFSEAFSLGFDVFSVCKNGKDLAKGTETIISKLIRARAGLWRSEMDSWRRMQDSLSNGLPTAQEKKEILEASFYIVPQPQSILSISRSPSFQRERIRQRAPPTGPSPPASDGLFSSSAVLCFFVGLVIWWFFL